MVSINFLHIVTVIFCIYAQIKYGITLTTESSSLNVTRSTIITTDSSFTTANHSLNSSLLTAEPEPTSNSSIPTAEPEPTSGSSIPTAEPEPTSGSSIPTAEPEPTNVSYSEQESRTTLPVTPEPEPTNPMSDTTSTISVSPSTTMLKTTTSETMSRKTTSTSSASISTQAAPLPIRSPFGTYGLAAFAIAFAVAIAELIIILVLIFLKRRDRRHGYNTAKAESRGMVRDLPMDVHMDAAFGGIHTVDLDSDNEDDVGNRKLGTSNGGVTTFGTETNKTESTNGQTDNKPVTDIEQPDWLKVELSAPETGEEANELIEPSSPESQQSPVRKESTSSISQEPTSPISEGPPEELADKDREVMSENESEPLLPVPPPELDINRSPTSSLSENSSLSDSSTKLTNT